MFDQKVIIAQQFPIPDKARKHTDVCCTVIGAIFAIAMLTIAIIFFSPDKYSQKFNNLDIYSCKTGYLHIPDINNLNSKFCMNACPQGYTATQQKLCYPYDTSLQQKYNKNTNITRQRDSFGFIKSLICAAIVSLGIGLMWMVLVFTLTKFAPMFAAGGAILSLILIIIFTAFSTQNFWGSAYPLKFPFMFICLALIIIISIMAFFYGDQMKFQIVLLKYSNTFLFENGLTFIYIPIFMIFSLGLCALMWFQNMAFQSKFASNNNKWDLANSGIYSALNIIQFLWGIQFLRDAFNFCVSGNAIDWYWTQQSKTFTSFGRLVCRHWGSVVGGSFLNVFFQIPTLIVQLLVCHPEGCCSKAGTFCVNTCSTFTSFFDLVRTDAYAYINLSGIPFCNAARNCSYLCDKSVLFIGNHSSIKHYRFIATVFLVTLVCCMTQFVLNERTQSIGFWNIFIGVTVIFLTLTWFINISADSAQSLQTSYLAQYQLEQTHKYMRRIRPSIKAQLLFLNNRQKHDGQF